MQALSKGKRQQLAALKQRKARREQGLFVAEGALLIEEAFKAEVFPLYVVACEELREGSEAAFGRVLEEAAHQGIEVFSAPRDEFDVAADTVNSQGMLAVFNLPVYDLDSMLSERELTLLVLDNVRDPGNLGTIVRHAAAFDCGGLLLTSGCVDAFNHKAVRASMGGIFHVPVFADLGPEQIMESLARADVWPYVTARDGANAFEIRYPPKTAFIIGGEAMGVQPFWDEREVIRVGIPQSGRIESLNAAVAAGIILAFRYQSLNQ